MSDRIAGESPQEAQANRESRTALGVATLRAVHQILDAEPKILDDTVIVPLLGAGATVRIRAAPGRFNSPDVRALRSHVLLRSRFAEDRLEEAVDRGVRQFLVLGAGLDTFAYRQPHWARPLRIFEVDQPASQQAKRQRLTAAHITVPPNVRFIEADFEHRTLPDILSTGGVALDQPAFISWLGVTVYLTEAAIDAVFRFVASLPLGSELVFTFYTKEATESRPRTEMAARAAELGEPFVTWFDPVDLDGRLRGFGFSEVSFLTPQEAIERYFPRPRADHLPPPRRINTASAVV